MASAEADFSALAWDHALRPRHYGMPSDWDGRARITGPCGDTMEFWVSLRADNVDRVSFVTDGCGSSKACGSMAVTLAEGRYLAEVVTISQADILAALGGLPKESEHCALLAASTLRAACEDTVRGNDAAVGLATSSNRPAEEELQ